PQTWVREQIRGIGYITRDLSYAGVTNQRFLNAVRNLADADRHCRLTVLKAIEQFPPGPIREPERQDAFRTALNEASAPLVEAITELHQASDAYVFGDWRQ